MGRDFSNVYDDDRRADSYARLEYPGTYQLAFRDLPGLFGRHVPGRRALDFGCGAGRSSRFLRDHGFRVVGIDVSEPMLERARALDPAGDYRRVSGAGFDDLQPGSFELVLSAFTFDNVATMAAKVDLLAALRRLLAPAGRLVNVVSAPEIYVNEWASFSTKDHPENRHARSGDEVRIVMLDVDDARPVVDILWSDEDWAEAYRRAELNPVEVLRPLGRPDEPQRWVSETEIAPWVIYVLEPAGGG